MKYIIVAIWGLFIGNYINIITYRLPVFLKDHWASLCSNYLNIDYHRKFSLAKFFSGADCEFCNKKLTLFDNIPLLSYIFAKGHCSSCNEKRSLSYPVVELVSAIIAVLIVNKFGVGLKGLLALLFSYALLVIAIIDFKTYLLPDCLTLPLLWLGLIINSHNIFCLFAASFWGAVLGFAIPYLLAKLYYLVRAKEGMAAGDFKLLSVIGAWLGWQLLPFVLLASLIASCVVNLIVLKILPFHDVKISPLAPFLCAVGMIALVGGSSFVLTVGQ